MALSIEQINKLEQENERLKAEFEIESLTDDITGEVVYRSNVAFRLADVTNKLTSKCVKYRQCLQEIKEIAGRYLTDCQGFSCDAMDEILQKIAEVKK